MQYQSGITPIDKTLDLSHPCIEYSKWYLNSSADFFCFEKTKLKKIQKNIKINININTPTIIFQEILHESTIKQLFISNFKMWFFYEFRCQRVNLRDCEVDEAKCWSKKSVLPFSETFL